MTDKPIETHALATWGIDVTDNFAIAIITPHAIVVDDMESNEFYELPPLSLTLDVLRRFHAELGSLIAYMEKGASGPATRN